MDTTYPIVLKYKAEVQSWFDRIFNDIEDDFERLIGAKLSLIPIKEEKVKCLKEHYLLVYEAFEATNWLFLNFWPMYRRGNFENAEVFTEVILRRDDLSRAVKEILNDPCVDEMSFLLQELFISFRHVHYLKRIQQEFEIIEGKISLVIKDRMTDINIEAKYNEIPANFEVKRFDFRSKLKGRFTYEDIVRPDFFVRLEEKLYEYDFIDLDYNFTGKHGRKQELAAIYAILIRKGYFRMKSYKYPKGCSNAHYRQYMDNRYSVDTHQQFKKITPEYIKEIEFKYSWLERLPDAK